MVSTVTESSEQVWVEGYTTRSGVQVEGHFRRRGRHHPCGDGTTAISQSEASAAKGRSEALARPGPGEGSTGGSAVALREHPSRAVVRSGSTSGGTRLRSSTATGVAAVEGGQEAAGQGQRRCGMCGEFAGDDHQCPARPKGLPDADYAGMGGQERVEKMLADLDESVRVIVESGQLQGWLDAMASNGLNRWSANNRLLAVTQLYQRGESLENLHLMGFRQWANMDRQVNKGAKAVWILAPVTKRFTQTDSNGVETDEVRVVAFKGVPVFNISDTHGKPLPGALVTPSAGEATPGTVEGLQERVGRAGFSYSEEEIPGCQPATGMGTLGYTEPETKRIVVDRRLGSPMKASTIAHELAHVHCGHVAAQPGEYRRHRGRMETEAEITAYLVNRSRGMSKGQVDAFSPGYIAGWSKGDPSVMRGAIDVAVKAHSKIMEGEWPK